MKTLETINSPITPEASSEVVTTPAVQVRINGATEEIVDQFYNLLNSMYDSVNIRSDSPLNSSLHPDSAIAIDVTVENGQWAVIAQLASEQGVEVAPWPNSQDDLDLMNA